MKNMNFKNYPYSYLNNIQSTFGIIRSQVNLNSDLVRITFDDDLCIVVEDIDYNSSFKYAIQNPVLKEGKVYYDITHTPKNSNVISENKFTTESTGTRIKDNIKAWIHLVSIYQNINIHPYNNVLKHYQNEIFNSFKFIEDDNDDKPLEYNQQVKITNFLNAVVVELEDSDEDNDEIIQEIKYLNSNITQLTQKQIKNALSWCFAKIRYKGIDIINKVTRVGVDYGLTLLLEKALETIIK
ncbi:hypothetical protein [Yeosuana marina]|uniref:hypothetical protein n=1 Tax=Yeosuana marina TaxID=1565536 RepID=UPI00141D8575|nr:hypothetical protein [Yeosuana marina]